MRGACEVSDQHLRDARDRRARMSNAKPRVIRWRRALEGPGYYAQITEGGLVVCTLVVVKRRLPFHRRSGIVIVDRWTVSILEADGRPRLDVAGGAHKTVAEARAAAVEELERIRAAHSRRGRTEAQDDGRACVRCGAEGSAMVPTGARGSRGAQLFECEKHRKGAA
jgi:hypothetical protein